MSRPAGSAVALQRKDEILERIATGEPLTQIAHSVGYSSHQGIEERLGETKEYQLAMRAGVIGKIERREKELEAADNNVAVTRADRLLGHARWWAENMDRARFGKNQDSSGIQVQVVIQTIERKGEVVIDAVQGKDLT